MDKWAKFTEDKFIVGQVNLAQAMKQNGPSNLAHFSFTISKETIGLMKIIIIS